MKIALVRHKQYGLSFCLKSKNNEYLLCFCHHLPGRSIKFLGIENYLCARCLGICIGGTIGAVALILGYILPFICTVLFLLPLCIDGFSQALCKYESNNTKRLITGVLFGFCSVYLGIYAKTILLENIIL